MVLKRFSTFIAKTIDKIVQPQESGQTIPCVLFDGIRELISLMIPSSNEKYKFLLNYIKTLKDKRYDISATGLS